MRRSFAVLGCLIFSALLSAGCLASAQQAGSSTSPQAQTHAKDGWDGECIERQGLREERQKIRADHEALLQERDRLKMQCMDAKGQDRSECEDKKKDLRDRMAALHDRIVALHDKVAAEEPDCRHGHGGDAKGGPWPERQEQSAPTTESTPQQPATTR